MNIRDVMQRERSALLGESLIKAGPAGTTVMPYSAVTEPDTLIRTPTWVRAMHPVTITSLPGRDRSMAFVQECASLQYKFLWIHAENDAYRDDYKTFLKDVHRVTETLPGNLHADHLYNRERARALQTPWIRLVLVDGPVNSSHGAGTEKSRTNNGVGTPGRDHTMDDLLLMKLCGVKGPKQGQPLTAEMMAHVHDVARLYGMSVTEVQRSIGNLMEVSAFPRGGR